MPDARALPPSSFLRLPDEMMDHIAGCLPDLSMPRDEGDVENEDLSLQSLASTCRRLRAIVVPLSWKVRLVGLAGHAEPSSSLTGCTKRRTSL